MPRSTSQNFCCQCLCPHSKLQPLPASAGDPPTLAGRSGSVSYGVTTPSPASRYTHYFACALQEQSLCFPQSCQSPAIKSLYPSKSDSLGIPPPIAGPPGWETWHGVHNLHSSGWTSAVQLFSSLWVTHPAVMGFDFIVIAPLIPSHCGFPFVFGCGVSFLVNSSVFLSMIVQQLAVIPVLLQEGVRARPSTPPSWTNLHIHVYISIVQMRKTKAERD